MKEGGKQIIYILSDEEKCLLKATYIKQLTDLKVLLCDTCTDLAKEVTNSHVRYVFSFLII